MKPDFTKINPEFKAEAKSKPEELPIWKTNEQIEVKGLFTKDNIAQAQHLDYLSGLPPFLRGPYPSMYIMRPWTIRQYAGFPLLRKAMLYRRNLAMGQKGLSIALIYPLIEAMIQTIQELQVMWEKLSSCR